MVVYGIWATWTLAQTAVGNSPIVMEVTVRARIFFIFTFCINILCAGAYIPSNNLLGWNPSLTVMIN